MRESEKSGPARSQEGSPLRVVKFVRAETRLYSHVGKERVHTQSKVGKVVVERVAVPSNKG